MPFTRISLRKGKSAEYLRAVSDALHQALTETFHVPADDQFQVIHQHDAAELDFDPNYLSGLRSDDFILFAITAGKPRDTATKRNFYKRLTDLLAQKADIRPADVMIVITTTAYEDWSFGNGVMATDIAQS